MKKLYNCIVFPLVIDKIIYILADFCGDAPVNDNCNVHPMNGSVSESVTYTCDPGYTIHGSDINTCKFNTTSNSTYWINEAPSCKRKYHSFLIFIILII